MSTLLYNIRGISYFICAERDIMQVKQSSLCLSLSLVFVFNLTVMTNCAQQSINKHHECVTDCN